MSPESSNDARALLARNALFAACGQDDLDALVAHVHWRDYADGQDIVREGEPADMLLLIEAGHADVLKRGDSGEHLLNRLQAGDAIGEMALFDRVPRSATVRAHGPVRVLVLPLNAIVDLAAQRPTLVPVLLEFGARVAALLRSSSSTAVAAVERALEQERTRSVMGRFTMLLILAYTFYTWVLGTAVQVKNAFGRSEYVTVPLLLFCCVVMVVFVRSSGYPASFFGLSLRNWRRHCVEAVLLTLPGLALTVLLKLAILAWIPEMHGQAVFQMFAPYPTDVAIRHDGWGVIVAYMIFAPLQELIYRGGLQGSLAFFLTGRWQKWGAITAANVIFSASHIYVSPGLAVMSFVAGQFWGWLYARQGTLVGVCVSHVLLGLWAFEVVNLGVLE